MTDRGEFEGIYERLSKYEELEGEDVEDWLKDLKRGDSVQVTDSEKNAIREIHEENQAENLNERNNVTTENRVDIDEEDVDYDGTSSTITVNSDGDTKEVELENVSGVQTHPNGHTYVRGENGQFVGTLR